MDVLLGLTVAAVKSFLCPFFSFTKIIFYTYYLCYYAYTYNSLYNLDSVLLRPTIFVIIPILLAFFTERKLEAQSPLSQSGLGKNSFFLDWYIRESKVRVYPRPQ